MPQPIVLKRSAVPAKVPLVTDLQLGEMAINTFDGKLYIKRNNGSDSIVEIGASAGGGGTPAGNSGEIQFNNAGAFAGAANVEIQGGDLVLATNSSPTVPSAGFTKLFARSLANKIVPAYVGPSGLDTSLQPLIARNNIAMWRANGNGTAISTWNATALTAAGTATARTVATTNVATRMRRIGAVSAATAAAIASHIAPTTVMQYTAGTGTIGGFFMVLRFVPSNAAAVAGERFFAGVTSATAAPTNVEPSTLTNCVGIAQLSTDNTQFYLVYGGSAAQAAIPLGTAVGAPNTLSTTPYVLMIFAPPGVANTYHVQLTNLATGVSNTQTVSGAATVVPQNTTLLGPRIWKTNNATAAAVAYDFVSLYIEQDQ